METTNPRKAGALILNNLSLFNEAAILMEQQITVKVFEVFQEITSYWITKNGWRGEAEWLNEEENIWMLPIEWHSSLDEDLSQIAVFWFGYENEDTDSYSIADLCGCGQSRLGFFFSKGDSIKKSNWKIDQNLFEEISEELNLLGFKTTGDKYNAWFFPLILESTKLATAYESDDFDEAMQPLLDALDSLLKARPVLDPLVTKIAAAVK